ncbi:hypothetical protein AAVH_28981, partial [Aphelenchoides avenae]
MSTVHRVAVSFNDGTSFSFILKIPTPRHQLNVAERCFEGNEREEEMAHVSRSLAQSHNAECDFYSIYDRCGAVPLATVWYTRKLDERPDRPGVVLAEDLTSSGAFMDITESVNTGQIRSVVTALAMFHAFQMMDQGSRRCSEGVNFHIERAGEHGVYEALCPKLVAMNPHVFQPLVAKLKPFINRRFAKYALVDCSEEL